VARKYIKDPELLKFIDLECFIWSTVNADMTPMINAGMVFCDRHFGGINYPLGGVGAIAENMVVGESCLQLCLSGHVLAVLLLLVMADYGLYGES
jgi:hypothetical protein